MSQEIKMYTGARKVYEIFVWLKDFSSDPHVYFIQDFQIVHYAVNETNYYDCIAILEVEENDDSRTYEEEKKVVAFMG